MQLTCHTLATKLRKESQTSALRDKNLRYKAVKKAYNEPVCIKSFIIQCYVLLLEG